MRKFLAPIFAAALSAAFFTAAAPANAGIADSCGRIELNSTAKCEMRVSGGCTASCEPPALIAQCSADLYVGCAGGCNATVDAMCVSSCEATCQADCTVNPANFDCAAECRGDCGTQCEAKCGVAASPEECKSSCRSTCAGECDARCDATPPSADCQAQCQSCCTGSCEAEANMDCQIDCQAKGYVSCTTELKGGCEAACQKPEGALFCDGQFVEVSNLDQCVADLKSLLQIEVTGYASGSANCSGGRCTAQGEAGFSCAQSAKDSSSGALGMLGALAAFGLALGRRKNQRA